MEDEDGIPNKRGEAYCACRYLNCGRKFKSLKALEEHLITSHNISWEAYTRYSPSRHHETIEEAATDSLGKRKDAYCTCTFMECGRKFKMLKNLEEHVTLYHSISWQLYTQYYHRSVRKAPEVEKSKSPKVEKKPSPYSAAVKTNESPSPSSSTVRSTSNGSASTTPVSVGIGMGSPVAASPMMSFLPPQSTPPYAQYPYLASQVPLVPTIIQYQPMITPSVLSYGSSPLPSLPQTYIGQPASLPMSPLPEPQSWYRNPSSHLGHQQPQSDSGILNLSCPKAKKTRPSSPPATTLDLSMSKTSRSCRPSTITSQSQKFTELNVPTPTYLNSYAKPSTVSPYKCASSFYPIAPKESRQDERWAGELNQARAEPNEWAQKHHPDIHNGVIVIQPDDHYEDRPAPVNNRIMSGKDYLEDSMYMYTKAYCEEMYQRSIAASASYPQDTSRDYSRLGYGRNYQSAFSPKLLQQQDRVEDLSRPNLSYPQIQASNLSLKSSNEPLRTSSQQCSYDSQRKTQVKQALVQKSNEIYKELTSSKSVAVKGGSLTTTSVKTKSPNKCLEKHVQSEDLLQNKCLKHIQSEDVAVNEIKVTRVNEVNVTAVKQHVEVSEKLKRILKKGSGIGVSISGPRRIGCPGTKLKRSSSMPNLNTCSDEADDLYDSERLVIDISDEDLPKRSGNKSVPFAEEKPLPVILAESVKSKQPKKAKQSTKCHLKLKSKVRNNQKSTGCRKSVISNASKSNRYRKSLTVFRKNCIKRKYRHLGLRKHIQGRDHKHPSLFCRLRLNLNSKIPNSCRLCRKNCDSGKVADANTLFKWGKLRKLCRPKGLSKLTSKGHASGQIKQVKGTDVDECNQPTVMLPKSRSTLVKLSVATTNMNNSDGSFTNEPSVDGSKEPLLSSRHLDTMVDLVERTVGQVWPLKILADSCYRTYMSTSVDLSRTCPKEYSVGNGHMGSEYKSSQLAVEPSSSKLLSKFMDRVIKDSSRGKSGHDGCRMRNSTLRYHWRTLRFLHDSSCADVNPNGVIMACRACNLKFNRKCDYVKHRLRAHPVYMCKVCAGRGSLRGHLYRYLATLTRHLMLDHGITTALDPNDWFTREAYAGIDLQGVPCIDNLDGLCLVTDDKIYTSEVVYTYTTQRGRWALCDVTAADPRQMAARPDADVAAPIDQTHQVAPIADGVVGATPGGKGVLKVSACHPEILLTVVEVQHSANTPFKR